MENDQQEQPSKKHGSFAKTVGTGLLILALPFAGTRIYNEALNSYSLETQSHKTESYATGLIGHVEYTRFSDGSQDVSIYPGFLRFFDSDFYQDIDGDGKVDRIRRTSAEWMLNSLSEILVRETDYHENRDRFDDADATLGDLMRRYDTQ